MEPKAKAAAPVSGGTGGAARALSGATGGTQEEQCRWHDSEGRHQLATARVQPPVLGQWHTIRVGAVGDHIQAYLNGALLLDHQDSRYRAGQVGLWTKADAITAFDDLVVRGVPGT